MPTPSRNRAQRRPSRPASDVTKPWDLGVFAEHGGIRGMWWHRAAESEREYTLALEKWCDHLEAKLRRAPSAQAKARRMAR